MATIPRQSPSGAFPTATNSTAVTWTAATISDDFAVTGQEILLIRNAGAAPLTVTVASQPDGQGRSTNQTVVVPAASYGMCGPFLNTAGWKTPGGGTTVTTTAVADTSYAVIALPV